MAEFPKKTLADWEKLATKELGAAPLADITWQTPEGIAVKPAYGPQDIAKLDFLDGMPGVAPYLRGAHRALVENLGARYLEADDAQRPHRICEHSVNRP